MTDEHWVFELSGGAIPLFTNMFEISKSCRPVVRATVGTGVALAAMAAIGLGSGVAGATPQQPVLVDDPVPVPAADPTSGVGISNAIFNELGALLNAVFPGSGSVFMPANSGASPVTPGYPSTLPGQIPATLPGQVPSTLPGQLPSTLTPGQIPSTLPGQVPGTLTPGQTPATPGTLTPGQTPATPGLLSPGQTPTVPGQPSALTPGQTPAIPGSPAQTPGSTSLPAPGQAVPVV